MMKRSIVACSLLVIALTGCAYPTLRLSSENAIATASSDLAAAKAVGAQWRLIDKATGGSAVGINKLLAAAEKMQAAGKFNEAIRVAERVSWAARMGIVQTKQQTDAKPVY
jgi:hypothetical protein